MKLQDVEEASAAAEAQAHHEESVQVESIESAKLEVRKLQAEDSKQQTRRLMDVKVLRQRLQTQLQRHEAAAARAQEGYNEDNAMWTKKLKTSEARSAKLENDVQTARTKLESIPVRAAAIEAENLELLDNCEKIEYSIRQVEETELQRRAELAKLRAELSDIQSKSEEVQEREQQYLQSRGNWRVSPIPTVPSPESSPLL